MARAARAPMCRPSAMSPSRADSGLAAGGGARIGHGPEGVAQGLELGGFERAAGAALAFGGLAGGGQFARAQPRAGVRVPFLAPEFLGPPVGNIDSSLF